MTIKLSACVITKNEEKNLPRWLKCMEKVADEIVVVDTGSVDNTVKLAEDIGAKVYHFTWINDFAAAKNYAIEHATGDWILFLDADETFTPVSQKCLRQVIERFDRDKTVACLLCRLLDIDEDNDNIITNTSILPRIFRRSPYIRYKGAIHEQLENTKGNKRMVFSGDLEILHTGYSSGIFKAKNKRNLPILLSELKKAKTEDERKKLYSYLMDAYCPDDYEKVIYYGQKCIDNGTEILGAPGHVYEVVTVSMFNVGKPFEEVLSKLDEAAEKYPNEPSFSFIRSMVLDKQGKDEEAEQAVLKAFKQRECIEKQMAQGVGAADTSRGYLPYAYERLGNIYSRRGEQQKAAENYHMALKMHKYMGHSLRSLCQSLAGADDVEVIELLNTLYDRKIDGKFILRNLKGFGSPGVMAYYGQGIKGFEIGYAYMASGRYDSAAVKLGQRYKELSQLGVLSAYNMEEPPSDGYVDMLVSAAYKERLLGEAPKDGEILKRLHDYRIRQKLEKITFPKDKMPLVSIMIPTYNRPELFERTLMSAINQTYPNVEILINDNSTNDDTQTLIGRYEGIVNLHYYRNKAAKTKAENFMPFEQHATGQYLQWCMDDDLLVADKLAKMVPVLRDNAGISLVSSIRGIVDGNDEQMESDLVKKLPIPAEDEYGYFYGEDMGRQMLTSIQNLIGEPSAVLFRRGDLLHHYWRAEARGYKTISDVAMWCELMEKGHCLIFKNPLSYYRRHRNQEGQRGEIVLLSRLEWMKLITEYYECGKFIKNKQDYKTALMVLYNEYKEGFSTNINLRQADNFTAYSEAMELITRLV